MKRHLWHRFGLLAAVVITAEHAVHGERRGICRSGDGAGGDRGKGNDDCESEQLHGVSPRIGFKRLSFAGPAGCLSSALPRPFMPICGDELKYRVPANSIEQFYVTRTPSAAYVEMASRPQKRSANRSTTPHHRQSRRDLCGRNYCSTTPSTGFFNTIDPLWMRPVPYISPACSIS